MKVVIFGTGYVGLVTSACLAEVGNDVLRMDADEAKIEALRQGVVPIHEPGLEAIVESSIRAGRLRFTCKAEEAVEHGLLQFIAVGSP